MYEVEAAGDRKGPLYYSGTFVSMIMYLYPLLVEFEARGGIMHVRNLALCH